MSEPIICYEHQRLARAGVSDETWDWLNDLAEEEDKEHKIGITINNKAVKFSQYAGYLQSPDGTQIMVLPKISNPKITLNDEGKDKEKGQQILQNMVNALLDPYYKSLEYAVDLHKDPKFTPLEWVFQQFLTYLGQLIKKQGLQGQYNPTQNNLNVLKGRVLWGKNITHNHSNAAKFYVQYNQFTFDSPINRLLKTATQHCLRRATTAQNQQWARQYFDYMDEIPAHTTKTQMENDIQQINNHKPHKKYDAIIPWCMLILKNIPFNNFANNQSITLMFEMNKLFESLVRSELVKANYTLKNENKNLIQIKNKKNMIIGESFAMKPDFIIEKNKEIIIADAKWKTIFDTDPFGKHGISQPDLYQLFVYAQYWKAKQVVLFYPKTDIFNKENGKGELQYKQGEIDIILYPFDCLDLHDNSDLNEVILNKG